MQVRNAASVFPDPVGAEISVVLLARMCGQPCSCGSVAAPNRPVNHSWTMGWAQLRVSKFIGRTLTLCAFGRIGSPDDKNNSIHLGARIQSGAEDMEVKTQLRICAIDEIRLAS